MALALALALEVSQIYLGVSDIIFNYPYREYENLLPDSWIKTVWRFMDEMNLRVKGWNCIIPFRREHDDCIMEVLARSGVSKNIRLIANRCRLHLRATQLSDIVTGSGYRLSKNSLKGLSTKIKQKSAWPIAQKPLV